MYLQIGGRSIKRNRFIAVEHAQGIIIHFDYYCFAIERQLKKRSERSHANEHFHLNRNFVVINATVKRIVRIILLTLEFRFRLVHVLS